MKKVLFSSKSTDWRTPDKVFQDLNEEFGFDYDPCPYQSDKNGLRTSLCYRKVLSKQTT